MRHTKKPPAIAPQTAKNNPHPATNTIKEKYTINCGDNLNILPNLPQNSVDLTITSPLTFNNENTPLPGKAMKTQSTNIWTTLSQRSRKSYE